MKKLNFEQIKEAILNYNARSDYKQASIVILRNIFEQAEADQLTIPLVVFSEAELKTKLEQQLEETRQWLIGEDFEGLAERL